jgi:hypothetical protein
LAFVKGSDSGGGSGRFEKENNWQADGRGAALEHAKIHHKKLG